MIEETQDAPQHAPFVVAEAGVNHNGSLERALELVDVAADAGADAVKFQTFRAEALASPAAPKAGYQQETTGGGGQLEMLRALELDLDAHRALVARCAERGVEFLSTPFDLGSLDLLLDLGVARVKVGSGDLTFAPLLHRIARSGRPVILSTGMATLEEIEEALGVLAHGYGREGEPASRGDFAAAYADEAARATLSGKVTILHCVSCYPAALGDANLRAMEVLAERFGLPVGYSDHTEGSVASVAAAALGAQMIEKHFTLDRSLPGPDHRASLEPLELAAMVKDVRGAAMARGERRKAPLAAETNTREVARRGIVAARALSRGQTIEAADLACMRPERGPSPLDFWDLVGRQAAADVAVAEPLREGPR